MQINQQHTCPAVIQLAVVKQWLGTKETEEPVALSPAPSTASSNKRKSPFDGAYSEQELPMPKIEFDASRDCRAGQHVCNHCEQSFGDFIGLRRHIELARCKKFQASRPPQSWILQNQPLVMDLMTSLHPEQWLCERELVARIRKECALCGRQFDHFRHLQTHLNQKHGAEVQKAKGYTDHLQNNFHPMGEACLCGHWLNKGLPHTCVVAIQLGILRNKSRERVPPPEHIMIPSIIDHWLLHGRHADALNHPEYEYIFAHHCSLCLNRHESPGDLWAHFEGMLPEAIAHLDQIVRVRQDCCPACRDLPAQVCNQAPRCPFLLNCILLEHLRHGPPQHDGDRGRSTSRAERRLRMSRESTYGGQSVQAEAPRPAYPGFTPRLGTSLLMPTHGVPPAETGRYAQCDLSRYHMGLFPRQEAERYHAATADGNPTLARAAQAGDGQPTSEDTAMLRAFPGDEAEAAMHLECEAGRFRLAGGSEIEHDHRGHDDSRLEVGSQPEAAGTHPRAESVSNRSSEHAGTDAAGDNEGGSRTEVPRHGQYQRGHQTDHSMEDATQLEAWQHLAGIARSAEGQRDLAVHTMQDQALESEKICSCTAAAAEHATGLPRESIQTALLTMKCQNPRNFCLVVDHVSSH